MEAKVILTTELQLKAIVADAVSAAFEYYQPRPTQSPPADNSPIISKKHIQEMTNWADGTFYAKVREMPEGVVIRGRSKRLLFNRQKFLAWLQTPVEP